MAGRTSLDPVVADSVAQQHLETRSEIDAQQTRFEGVVADMKSASPSAMLIALERAHESWRSELHVILADLSEMSELVKGNVQNTVSTDEASAGQVSRQGGILAGL